MNFSGFLLKIAGWKVEVTVPDYDKSIIVVAPHTSNWDFLLGKLAYNSINRNACFLIKDTWFFFPLNYFFKWIGGIPVPRKRKGPSVVDYLVNRFKNSEKLSVAITPEGTRSRTAKWKTGFLQVSLQAHVPCVLAVLDYGKKEVKLNDTYWPTGDIEADMRHIKNYYKPYTGKYPENFTTE